MGKEITFTKVSNNLCSAEDPDALDFLKRIPLGGIIRGTFVAPRNPIFHRKFFAMLNVGFEAWEMPVPGAEKNFAQFREDVTILAGHYTQNVRLNGEVRTVAKSIKFASMDEITFEQLYSSVANVLLTRVLTNYTRDDLDSVVDSILRFADG